MSNRGLSVCVVLVLAMGLAPGVAFASPQANWAPGIDPGVPGDVAPSPNSQISVGSISCPSAGNCSAVGEYNDNSAQTQGLLLTETSGTWAPGIRATVPAGATATFLDSLSCATPGNCTAVGLYQVSGHSQGLAVTETSGIWGPAITTPVPPDARPTPDVTLGSVSCPSVGDCSAVGTYYNASGLEGLLLTETSGTWTASTAVLPSPATDPSASLQSVSCASPGNCSAVGNYKDSGGNDQGVLLNETSGVWAPGVQAMLPAAATNPQVGIPSVSCASAGNCAAVGGYQDSSGNFQALLLTEQAGIWAPAAKATLPGGAATNPEAGLDRVSCAAPGNCSAVGAYFDTGGSNRGLLVSQSSGAWGPAQEATLPGNAAMQQNAHFNIASVSCASPGNCSAVGEYRDSSSVFQGFFLTQSAGAWQAASEAAFPGQGTNQSAFMQGVSCATVAACSATGGFFDSSSNRQSALFATVSATPTVSVTAPAAGTAGGTIGQSSVAAVLASGSSPVGTIAFRVFGPQSSPPASCSSGGTTLGSAGVAGNGFYHPASSFIPPGAGNYWWYATYGGDASDNAVGSSCGPLMAKTVVPGPVLTGFRQSHRRWRESAKAHGPPVGTTFKFTLSESATVTLVFSKHAPGRAVKSHGKTRCVAPAKHNKHRRACTRMVVAGKLKLAAKAGHDKVVFKGRTASHHKLPPGTYTVTITAVNAGGTSAPRKLTFTILA